MIVIFLMKITGSDSKARYGGPLLRKYHLRTHLVDVAGLSRTLEFSSRLNNVIGIPMTVKFPFIKRSVHVFLKLVSKQK